MKRDVWPILLTLLPGCLTWPGDIPNSTTEVTNRPPKILDNLTYPSPEESVVILNSNCGGFSFSTYVTDPDLDTLYYRFFVNYYLIPTPYASGVVNSNTLSGSGRAQVSTWLANRENGHLLAAENMGYDFDVIELLVSDRPFVADDFRTTEEVAQIDRYTWTIMRRDLGPCQE